MILNTERYKGKNVSKLVFAHVTKFLAFSSLGRFLSNDKNFGLRQNTSDFFLR